MSNGVLPALSDNHFGITFMYKARPPKGAGIVNETKINFADTCWPCSTGRWTWSRGRSRRGSSACKDCNITKCKQDQIQPVVKRFSSEKSQKLWLCFPPWVDGHGDEGYIRVGWFLSRAECRRPGSLLAHLANLWFGEIFEGVAVVTCNLATSGLNCIWRSTRVCWYSPASVKVLQPRCRNISSTRILPVDAGALWDPMWTYKSDCVMASGERESPKLPHIRLRVLSREQLAFDATAQREKRNTWTLISNTLNFSQHLLYQLLSNNVPSSYMYIQKSTSLNFLDALEMMLSQGKW